jgi:20S proteasome subunit alpha 7
VLGVEKLLPFKMLVPGSSRRIAAVDLHAGMAGTVGRCTLNQVDP